MGAVETSVAVVIAGADPAALLDPEDTAGVGHVRAFVPARDREPKQLGRARNARPHARTHPLELDQGEADPGVVVVVAVAAEPSSDRI